MLCAVVERRDRTVEPSLRIPELCVAMSTPESGGRSAGRRNAGRLMGTGERWAALAVSQGAERL